MLDWWSFSLIPSVSEYVLPRQFFKINLQFQPMYCNFWVHFSYLSNPCSCCWLHPDKGCKWYSSNYLDYLNCTVIKIITTIFDHSDHLDNLDPPPWTAAPTDDVSAELSAGPRNREMSCWGCATYHLFTIIIIIIIKLIIIIIIICATTICALPPFHNHRHKFVFIMFWYFVGDISIPITIMS